jgi:hypothetical protein
MRVYSSLIAAWLAAMVLSGPTSGWTAESSSLDEHARAVDRTATSAGSQQVAGRIASQLNDSWGRTPAPYSAESLATQRAQTGWGWGGLLIGNRLAQHMAEARLAANPTLTPEEALAQSLAAVTAARQAHTGWGVIAHENGVKLGPLVSSVKHSTEAVTTGARSGHTSGAKTVDRAAAKSAALEPGERAARGAERGAKSNSGKSDKGRAEVAGFSNSFDTGHQRGGSAVVSGTGVAAATGYGGAGHGRSDKGTGPGAGAGSSGRGGGNAEAGPGGGHGGDKGGGNGGGGGGGKGK